MAAAEQEACRGSRSLIQEGDQVVLRMNKTLKIVQVRKNRKIFFEKLHFVIDDAINSPYGSVFEVKGDKLNLIKPGEDVDELQATSAENGESSLEYQPIKSDGQSQKLTRDDVDALKSQGASGQEIVKQLVENSETFKDRTEFSQAKYKNKKNKKYNAKITILKPTTRLIASTFYSPRMSNKICELRPDALSQLLSLANIRANSKVIVVEQCQGLVVGAVLDRMGGRGNIVQIHSGDFPNRLAMECYGFSSSFMEIVNAFPLNKVNSLKGEEKVEKEVDETKQQQPELSRKPSEEQRKDISSSETEDVKGEKEVVNPVDKTIGQTPVSLSKTEEQRVDNKDEETTKTDVDETKEQPHASSSKPSEEQREKDNTTTSETVDNTGEIKIEKIVDETKQQPSVSSSKDEQSAADVKEQERIKRRNQRQLEERNARNALLSRNMDSLVVVCKLDPSTIVLGLLDYVAPSRPFVIFSTFKEPLVECFADLKNRGGVVNLQLTETWWRQYQVLPGRTHPLVNMDGAGGYLLSGTTVERHPETDSNKMNTQDERTTIRQPPSSAEKHGANQNQEGENGEPPAKKPKEQTGTSGEKAEVPVTHSKVTVIASQTVRDKTDETSAKKWRQRGKRSGRRIRIKAGISATLSPEEGNSVGQTLKDETGEPPAKKWRQRGKRGGKKAFNNAEIHVNLPFPPPHSHPFPPPPLLSFSPPPVRTRPPQFNY